MTERRQYSEDQLEEIADAIWGTGLYRSDEGLYNVPCPVCGADIRAFVSQAVQPPPRRFRAICSSCGIDSSGLSSSADKRDLAEEECEEILHLHIRGEQQFCPSCRSPLAIRELPIAGSGTRHFKIACLRCGTGADRRYAPGEPIAPANP